MSGLWRNFSALTVLRALNVLVPLGLYPWLFLQLGAESLGIVVFAQAVATYFMVVPNYNLETFGTGLVAKAVVNAQVKDVASHLLGLKVLLFLVSLAGYAILMALWPFAQEHFWIFFWSTHLLIQEAFLPTWFFQGVQRVQTVAGYNALSKGLAIVWMVIFVRDAESAYHVPLGYWMGSSISAVLSTWNMRKRLEGFAAIQWKRVKQLAKEGWPYFITSVNGYLYVYANRILMGAFGMQYVAYYDLADKWLQMGKAPQQILGLSLFPRISQSPSPKAILRKYGPPSALFNAALAAGLFMLSPWIVSLSLPELSTTESHVALTLMRILSLNIFFSGLNSIFVIQGLLGAGRGGVVMRLTLETLLAFALGVATLYFTDHFTPYSLSMAAVAAEVYLVLRAAWAVLIHAKSWE